MLLGGFRLFFQKHKNRHGMPRRAALGRFIGELEKRSKWGQTTLIATARRQGGKNGPQDITSETMQVTAPRRCGAVMVMPETG